MKGIQHIKNLLEKYWEGETTFVEEETLQAFFANEEIPTELLPFKILFQAKTIVKEATISDDFDDKLFAQLEDEQQDAKVISIQEKQSNEIKKLRWIAGIAASIALLLAVYIVMPRVDTTQVAETELTKEEHKEAMKAYKQTKAALLFVSAKMNQGTQTAAKGLNKVKNLDQVLEAIEKE